MVLFNFCQLSKAQLVPFRVVSRGYYKAHFPKFNMQSHVGLKKTKLVDQYSLKGSNVFQSQNTSLQSRHGLIKVFRKLIKKNCKEGSPKLLGINQNCGLALGFGTVLVASCQQFTRASCHSNNGETSTRLLEKKIVETSEKSADFDLWLFLQFLRPDLLLILLSVLSAITVAFINIQIPVFLGDLVQVVSHFTHEYSGDYLKEIKTPAVKLVSAYSLQALGTACYISLLGVIGERLATRMRTSLFASLLKQDIVFFDTHHTGELVNRLSGDVQEFKRSFKLCISQGIRGFTQIIGSSVSLYLLSPRLTIVMLGTVPVIIIIGTFCGALLRRLSRSAQEQVSRAMSVADEALANIRTVRAFAMEPQEGALFETEVKKAERLNSVLGCGIGIFQGFSNLFLNGLVLGVVYCGGYLMSSGTLQAGQLMSFLVAAQSIQRSIATMSILFGQAVRGISAGGRVFEFIKLVPSVRLSGGITIPYHSLYANVEFSNVHFSYPSRPEQKVLDNFSLSLPRGKVVAICGPSGAGKSTVAALLERFYDLEEGSVTIDGHSLEKLDPSWLRGHTIGYINQAHYENHPMEKHGQQFLSLLIRHSSTHMAVALKVYQKFTSEGSLSH